MNILNLSQFWKSYDDGTQILFIHGVQVASVQPKDEARTEYEVYAYDSDFQGLFEGCKEYEFKSVDEAKNKVANLFVGWINQVTWALTSPCPNV